MLSKLGAGRGKDIRYVEAAVRHEIVSVAELKSMLKLMPETVSWDPHRNPREIAAAALDGIEERFSHLT